MEPDPFLSLQEPQVLPHPLGSRGSHSPPPFPPPALAEHADAGNAQGEGGFLKGGRGAPPPVLLWFPPPPRPCHCLPRASQRGGGKGVGAKPYTDPHGLTAV